MQRAPSFGQAAGLGAIWVLASFLIQKFAIPLSAGVLGFFAVLLLLWSGALRSEWVSGGAGLMLNDLVLFFIPAVVAVIKYADLFRAEGIQLVGAIAVGTVLVMASTAVAVHFGCLLQRRILHH
jgi:holin-like protein